LKIFVERAVRPVRASIVHKRTMREELLAHVSAVFAEERARLGDDGAALVRTAERLGESVALTGELQEAVPWIERSGWWVAPPLCLRRSGESRPRCAFRQCLELSFFLLWTEIAGSLLLFGIAFLLTFDQGPPVQARELPLLLAGAGIGLVVSLALSSTAIVLVHGMIYACYERTSRSWALIVLLGAVAALLGVSVPLALFWLGQLDAQTKASDVLAALPGAAAVGPVVLLCLARVCWRLTDGSIRPSWQQIARRCAGGGLAIASVLFAAGVALSGDVAVSLESTLKTILAISSWVLPLELALCSSRLAAKIRADQEWANLPIDQQKGAPA
jgi:hypothetical protein